MQTPLLAGADRPLLSRVAESIFWLARYVERAEQVARILKVNTAVLMDVGELAPVVQQKQWYGVVDMLRVAEPLPGPEAYGERVARYMTFDTLNPASIVTSLSRARENARAVRSELSAEAWRCMQGLYYLVKADDARTRFEEQPEAFYDEVMTGAMALDGVCSQTLLHDQRFLFLRIGRALERAEFTCRILDSRTQALAELSLHLETPIRNILWMSVLRMCCCIEAYRRQHVGDLEPAHVLGYVIFERGLPRSLHQNVDDALQAISGIRKLTTPHALDPAERVLGRLCARLDYIDPNEFNARTAGPFLRQTLADLNEASGLVQQTYFLK